MGLEVERVGLDEESGAHELGNGDVEWELDIVAIEPVVKELEIVKSGLIGLKVPMGENEFFGSPVELTVELGVSGEVVGNQPVCPVLVDEDQLHQVRQQLRLEICQVLRPL